MKPRATHELQTVPPRGDPTLVPTLVPQTDPDVLDGINRDAAAMQGTGAVALLEPRSEAELARWLKDNPSVPVLVQGALTSLTGGATPDRDTVVSTRKLASLSIDAAGRTVTVGSGVLLATLQEALAEHELWYPPAPTHDGATIGGNVATNAAGAATFKYGSTRDWVERVRMVLRNGDVIEVRRGEHETHAGESVAIRGTRDVHFEIPRYQTPDVRKISAGYFSRSPMDLLDLLIGAEGTLGVVTEVELRVLPRPKTMTGLVFFSSVGKTIEFVRAMRGRSLRTRESPGRSGLDARSIEFFDRRCLELLREGGKLSEHGLTVPDDAAACLLFEVELPADATADRLVEEMSAQAEAREGAGGGAAELMALLTEFDVVERCELALPGQSRRQKQLALVREAIPLAINEWLTRWQRIDPEVQKAGGDMIVPMDRFAEMLARYYASFGERGVDVAVFGHISDGNVHPNALPRSGRDVSRAKEALLELAGIARQMGGSPLSEHGVGKHPLKKTILAQFWGREALDEMRAIKSAFDPEWTLNRGVLFDPGASLAQREEPS